MSTFLSPFMGCTFTFFLPGAVSAAVTGGVGGGGILNLELSVEVSVEVSGLGLLEEVVGGLD
jgi:hypothetical protein